MVRERELFFVRLMKATDAVAIAFSFVTAYFLTLVVKDILDLGALAFAPSISLGGAFFFLRNHLWLVLVRRYHDQRFVGQSQNLDSDAGNLAHNLRSVLLVQTTFFLFGGARCESHQ